MEISEALLDTYLPQQHMMQLATAAGEQPWCCTVYYVHDEAYSLYWASLPSRRHSQEIATNNKVAATIPVKHVNGEKVIGVQMAGVASLLQPSPDLRTVVSQYAARFGRDEQWIEDFITGKTEHLLYKLIPHEIVVFDEVNFPHNTRLQLRPS